MNRIFTIIIFLFISISSVFSQDTDEYDSDGVLKSDIKSKGLHLGLYIGSYFANKYTAKLYDGYGFDVDGNRNSFENSFMYHKIVLEYGGGYGQPDYIATALNVQHGEWAFSESDMPINMKYSPAFLLGLQGRYSVDKNNAILLNVNASQLNITGNFTITTTPPTNSTQINKSIKTFAIKGVEQRMMFQMGYQRIFGDDDKINLFAEGGLHVTLAKFDHNVILINDLLIDLTSYYYQPGFNAYAVQKPIGFGFGAFAGIGVNLNMNSKFRVQFLYNPTYEGINIGPDPKLKLQHSIGLRFYYNL
jgi:hypothetical protein